MRICLAKGVHTVPVYIKGRPFGYLVEVLYEQNMLFFYYHLKPIF